jgi:hypothetical protein
MDAKAFNEQIAAIVDGWCERRELNALANLLQPWLYNNGLTDGWEELAKALRSTANVRELPEEERHTLKRLWVELDTVLRNR